MFRSPRDNQCEEGFKKGTLHLSPDLAGRIYDIKGSMVAYFITCLLYMHRSIVNYAYIDIDIEIDRDRDINMDIDVKRYRERCKYVCICICIYIYV